jgi:hypothetical protein
VISEKTVELNLTTEWLNYLFGRTHRVHFAIAPSQQLEAAVPIDAALTNRSGGGILLQYKRAYVDDPVWTWHLNRTAAREQHQKLQRMQQHGLPVFHALPFFHTVDELAAYRRRLLRHHTFFFRPLSINPPGGPVGHHDLHYDLARDRWSISSPDDVEIEDPISLQEVARDLDKAFHMKNLQRVIEAFSEEFSWRRTRGAINDSVIGASIVARVEPLSRRRW